MRRLLALAILAVSTSGSAEWSYETSIDKMTSKRSAEATVRSNNQLEFDFPYKGPNWGFLTVRQHPQWGLDVIVSINKGQMLCGYSDCSVTVRFDDSKPVRFSGNGPADHSSTSIFLSDRARFIAGARKAKKILVQFNAYQSGSPVLEFSTPAALQWPPK